MSGFEACHAGSTPKITPVTSARANENSSTRTSSPMASTPTTDSRSGITAGNALSKAQPTTSPARPPTTARLMLSTSVCETMRLREAPSAERTAISRRRGRGARDQQVGDVDARDQQHEANGHEEHDQRRAYRSDVDISHPLDVTP